MTDSTPTLDPRARQDRLGTVARRLLGPIPEVSYIPPEGCTETEPPYNSDEIRYWKVVGGIRQRRHRSMRAALRDCGARGRLAEAMAGVRSRAFILTGLLTLAFCSVSIVAGSVLIRVADDVAISGTASVLGGLLWMIVAVAPFCISVRRMGNSLLEGRFRAELSKDEWGLLLYLTFIPVLAAYVTVLLLSTALTALILPALGLGTL